MNLMMRIVPGDRVMSCDFWTITLCIQWSLDYLAIELLVIRTVVMTALLVFI